jgi:hypothetical protein
VFTTRYGLIPYIKQITFRLYKVKPVYDDDDDNDGDGSDGDFTSN